MVKRHSRIPRVRCRSCSSRSQRAFAESFNASLKRELLAGRAALPDQVTAYRAVFRWTTLYNTRRDVTPVRSTRCRIRRRFRGWSASVIRLDPYMDLTKPVRL